MIRLTGSVAISLIIVGWSSFRVPGILGIKPACADVFSVSGTGIQDMLVSGKAPGRSLISIGGIAFNGLKLPVAAAESDLLPGDLIRSMRDRIGDGFYGVTNGRNVCWGGYYKNGKLSLLLAMRNFGTRSTMYSCTVGDGSLCKFLKRQADQRPEALDNKFGIIRADPESQCLNHLVLGKKPVACNLYHCRTSLSAGSLVAWYAESGRKAGWNAGCSGRRPGFLMLEKNGDECYLYADETADGLTEYTLLTLIEK